MNSPKPPLPVLALTLLLGILAGQPLSAARTPWTTSRLHGTPDAPPSVAVERVYPALQFKEPTDFLHDPATGRWFVSELSGRIVSFASGDAAPRAELVVDLARRHQPFAQLLGFTLDPGFATNRLLYVAWVDRMDPPGNEAGSHISRLRLSATGTPVAEDGETEVITWRGGGHNGACLKFGPDGMLYFSTGDGSSPEPPDALRTGQDLDDLLSCIVRIDVHRPDGARAYSIPRDNPFVGRPGARGEIWAYGFRNPWRMDFGPGGALWVADVGWELWETVHRVRGGYNGGWSRVEGPQLIHGDMDPPTPVSAPVAAHPHSEAASITGGCFYDGRAIPSLRGAYVYGDWETGKLWALRETNAGPAQVREIITTTLRVVSFAKGPDHELYFLDHQAAGGIHKVVPPKAGGRDARPFPRRLGDTGLFADVRRQEPAAGVAAYAVTAPRWHDGATTRRWVAVPGTNAIRAGERWVFPEDTVLVKSVGFPAKDAAWRPVETQLLHFDGARWRAYTYRWDDAGKDAELVPANGANGDLDPFLAERAGSESWRFHSRTECLRCHNSWSGFALGFNAAQLGKELPRLVAAGVVESAAGQPAVAALVDPHGGEGDVAARARSWLHANCAPCHRWGAGGAVPVYFPFEEPLDKLRIVDIRATRGDFGLADPRLLAPGHPERSVLWHRINTAGAGHMPLVGSRRPDPAGARLVADWIRSLGKADGAVPAGTASPSAALALLDAALPGRPAADAVASGLASANPVVRDLFMAFAPASARKGLLGDGFDPSRVLRLRGDAARGLEVMRRTGGPNCLGCHRHGDEGRAFGPDFADIARRLTDAQALAEIVEPSRTVAPQYATHALTMADGSEWAGIVASADGGMLRLRDASGQDRVLAKADVRKDERQPLSAMPEGLLSNLTPQEAADVLAAIRIAGRRP